MATLTDARGDWIALEILDYEFPAQSPEHEHEHDWDANWLMIRLPASLRGQEWSAKAPELLTWSIRSLVQFVEALADGTAKDGDEWFNLEPYIWMRVREGNREPHRIVLHLADSFRPPSKSPRGRANYVLSITPGAFTRLRC